MDEENNVPPTSPASVVANLNILDDIKVNLNILAQLKPGDKLVQRDRHFDIDRWDYTQPLRRWYNADSRSATINNLEQFVSMTFRYIDDIYNNETRDTGESVDNSYYMRTTKRGTFPVQPRQTHSVFSDEHSSILLTLFSNLENANKGLGNLMRTYEGDIAICARIKVIVEQIEIRMSKIKGIMKIEGNNQSSATPATAPINPFQGTPPQPTKEYVLRSAKTTGTAPPPPPPVVTQPKGPL